jgi:Ca2+-binding EF-hand superfamily protein
VGAQVFDRQKTGVISAQDLRHLFTKLGEKMEDAEVRRSLCQKNPPSDTPVS